MSKWFRWWKDRTFLKILGVVMVTMGIIFVLAYFIDWGWIPAIAMAICGGLLIRKMVTKKLDDLSE